MTAPFKGAPVPTPPRPRRVVSFQLLPDRPGVIALCGDGTLWACQLTPALAWEWSAFPPVPQPKAE